MRIDISKILTYDSFMADFARFVEATGPEMVDFVQNLVNFANNRDFDKIIPKESCQKREKCKGGTRFEGWQQDDIIQILTINTRKPLADKIFQKEIIKGITGNHYGR